MKTNKPEVSTEPEVLTGHGLYYDYLYVERYQHYPILYVHKLKTGYVLTRSHDQGCSTWIKVNGQEHFKTIDDINEALNHD